jgi:hypothetical protein
MFFALSKILGLFLVPFNDSIFNAYAALSRKAGFAVEPKISGALMDNMRKTRPFLGRGAIEDFQTNRSCTESSNIVQTETGPAGYFLQSSGCPAMTVERCVSINGQISLYKDE